jgi:lipopolysaccharide export system protein LptA
MKSPWLNAGRDIALRCPRPRRSGRHSAAERAADGAARRPYLQKNAVLRMLVVSWMALWPWGSAIHAQSSRVTQGKDFSWPAYYSTSNGVQRLKSLLTGSEVQLRPPGLSVFLLKHPRLENYRPDGTLEWIATAADCIVDTVAGTVSGNNRLVLKTGNTNLFTTGVGFLSRQSDSTLILSNQSFTWIDNTALAKSPRREMKAFGAMVLMSAAALAADVEQPPPRPGLVITGQLQIISLEAKTIYYSNDVLVVDPPAKPGESNTTLRCQELTAKQNATGAIESIIADRAVEIDQGDKHARADHAVYLSETDQITLTGVTSRPRIISGQITNTADRIIYDRRSGKIFASNVLTEASSTALPRPSQLPTSQPPAATNKNADPKKPQLRR